MTRDDLTDALSKIVQAIAWPKAKARRMGAAAACLLLTAGLVYSVRSNNISQLAYSFTRLFPSSSSSSACLAALEPEEIFARNTAIFRGTVTNIQRYKDYSVYTIEVSHSLRGSFDEGKEVRLLTAQGISSGNSLEGYLRDLSVGTEAVFMPYSIEDGPGLQGDISHSDFITQGDCYISEGHRYLFVQDKNSVLYDESTYVIPTSDSSVTLDDVEAYIQEMLAK